MNDISSLPILDPLDKRLNAYRPDLAEIALMGLVKSTTFVAGKPAQVCNPVSDVKASPDEGNTQHQYVFGEELSVFEHKEGWVWAQSCRDGFVGYVPAYDIKYISADENPNTTMMTRRETHVVQVPFTFLYPKAELRAPPKFPLSMGSQVQIVGYETVRGTKYALFPDGRSIIALHLREIGDHASDYVQVCEQMLGLPYLWGGASGFGIDCSALVQLAMRMAGKEMLRDSDMQAATIGDVIDARENYQNLQRGDLIFWPGHVAVCQGGIAGEAHIIHASGHTMQVASEPLLPAIERIAYLYQKPIGFRRP